MLCVNINIAQKFPCARDSESPFCTANKTDQRQINPKSRTIQRGRQCQGPWERELFHDLLAGFPRTSPLLLTPLSPLGDMHGFDSTEEQPNWYSSVIQCSHDTDTTIIA